MNRVNKQGGSQNPNVHGDLFRQKPKHFRSGEQVKRMKDRRIFVVVKVDAFGIYLEGQEGAFAAAGFEAV